ncbi:MAG TPA: glycosyltransferase [Anaerolineales bacterium]|nr:glycosyltransferase [Anaerolineales bacterium]
MIPAITDHRSTDRYAQAFGKDRKSYWDSVVRNADSVRSWGGYYHRRLAQIYRHLVPPGSRVIEFGCGQGDLLAALEPGFGVGIDFSHGMLLRARQRHPELRLVQADVHAPALAGTFDVIILSDLLNDVWDVQRVLEQAASLAAPDTRVIFNSYSRVWQFPLAVARMLRIAQPVLQGNWLTVEDFVNLADLADLEVFRHWREIIWPLPTPLLARFFNAVVVRFWPVNPLALTNFLLARLKPHPPQGNEFSVSVVVPARNEAGNIPEIFARSPEMGAGTELVFVEGHSQDGTYDVIREEMSRNPHRRALLLQQSGVGKGDAVRLGFTHTTGDILMILDADLTVPPEDLPRFYDALSTGKGELINGVRLVYPMEGHAMNFLNFLGNKFFSMGFSWLLGQPIKDTLCGTKVMWDADYRRIASNRAYFGEFDPFGDFDLIFGAVKLNRKIMDMPVRYRERKYGTTNIQRWRHGWLLLKMLVIAARRIKFV